MGASNILALLMEITSDPSKADASIQAFAQRTGQSIGMVEAQVKDLAESESAAYSEAVQRARGAGEELDKSLIGNRESVRLLSEEFGLRLPRAVTGAIGQALPEIASLGGALLGVFALEQAYKWGKVVNDQFFQIWTHGDQTIKDLDSAASAAFKHAADEAADALAHFKTSLAGAFDIAQIDAHMAQLVRFREAYKSLTGKMGTDLQEAIVKVAPAIAEANAQGLKNVEDVDQKINELGQLQFDAHKRLAEVQAGEDRQRAEETKRQAADAARASDQQAEAQYRAVMAAYEANQKAFHASEEALKRLMALQDHLGRQAVEAAHKEEEGRE
ncbi:MAG: hypothetical protein WCD04_11675, partial [Terriglobia bacterium]